MSYGKICKHCRMYRDNHVDAQCSNGKFELATFQDELKKNPELLERMRKLISSEKQRFRLEGDGEGHDYLIPDDKDLLALFRELVEMEDGWADDRWQQFEDMRIDNFSRFSFENPIEDK